MSVGGKLSRAPGRGRAAWAVRLCGGARGLGGRTGVAESPQVGVRGSVQRLVCTPPPCTCFQCGSPATRLSPSLENGLLWSEPVTLRHEAPPFALTSGVSGGFW